MYNRDCFYEQDITHKNIKRIKMAFGEYYRLLFLPNLETDVNSRFFMNFKYIISLSVWQNRH